MYCKLEGGKRRKDRKLSARLSLVLNTMEDASSSLPSLSSLPLEIVCIITYYLEEEDLVSLSRSCRLGRAWVHGCVRRYVGDITFPVLMALGSVSVSGVVTVRSMEEVAMVSQQVQGSLHLVIQDLTGDSLVNVLRFIRCRSTLYPAFPVSCVSCSLRSPLTRVWAVGSEVFGAHVTLRVWNEETVLLDFDRELASLVADRSELSLNLVGVVSLEDVIPETVRAIQRNTRLQRVGLWEQGDNLELLNILSRGPLINPGGPPRSLTTIFSYTTPGSRNPTYPWKTINAATSTIPGTNPDFSLPGPLSILADRIEATPYHQRHTPQFLADERNLHRMYEAINQFTALRDLLSTVQELRDIYIPVSMVITAIHVFPKVRSFDLFIHPDSGSHLSEITDFSTLSASEQVAWDALHRSEHTRSLTLRLFRSHT